MSARTDKEFLLDIQEAIRRINLYTSSLTYDEFFENIQIQDAVLRNLEIIGEAVKNLSQDLKKRYKNVPWKDIAGMRDKIIHFYFGVNLDIVWDTIKEKLPILN